MELLANQPSFHLYHNMQFRTKVWSKVCTEMSIMLGHDLMMLPITAGLLDIQFPIQVCEQNAVTQENLQPFQPPRYAHGGRFS